jgi:hypothetical protein
LIDDFVFHFSASGGERIHRWNDQNNNKLIVVGWWQCRADRFAVKWIPRRSWSFWTDWLIFWPSAEIMGELANVSLHVEECGGLDRIEDLHPDEPRKL